MVDTNAVINYSADGYQVPVKQGAAVISRSAALLIAGKDENDYARIMQTDEFGSVVNTFNSDLLSQFGELRTANPYTLVDIVNKYNISSILYSQQVSGGSINHLFNQSAISLDISGTSGQYARLRTNEYYRYQAGKGIVIKQTAYFSGFGNTNQNARFGFFDGYDGLYWELSNSTFRLARRSSASGVITDTYVNQSSWNMDKLDGAGKSGMVLDITKGNIYEIRLQWLGVGHVYFFIDGILVHKMENANKYAMPYMATAQLPLSWEIENVGTSSSGSLISICSSITAEGGSDPPEFSFAAYTPSIVTATTAERPILSIRVKRSFNGHINRMIILPRGLSISTDTDRIIFRVVLNTILTGANFTSVDSDSGVEYDISASAFSGGNTLFVGFLPNTKDFNSFDLSSFFKHNGRQLKVNAFNTASDIITIIAADDATGNTGVRASLSWAEIR